MSRPVPAPQPTDKPMPEAKPKPLKKTYPPEFKQDAVKLITEFGRSHKDTAKQLGCTTQSNNGSQDTSHNSNQTNASKTATPPNNSVADNVLDRNFTATKPNETWLADITYLELKNGFVTWRR